MNEEENLSGHQTHQKDKTAVGEMKIEISNQNGFIDGLRKWGDTESENEDGDKSEE